MNGQERRMTYRLTSEWVGLKRQQRFPPIGYLNPNTLSVDWNQCVLIRLMDDQMPPREECLEFEFVGEKFLKDAPSLAAGSPVSAIPETSMLSFVQPLLPKLFDRQTAVIYGGCQQWQSTNTINFHVMAVPFSDDCGTFKYALCTLSYTVLNTAITPEDTRAEFMAYCDGGWSTIESISKPELIQAA
jgi:hypothetical protein